ncbi:MFS transporter [Acuticoccus sediminis]|nr:MFS transporter [Acuticoccus sediminis]
MSSSPDSTRSMWAPAIIVTVLLVLSNAPTPLYVFWQAQHGFSSAVLSALFSSYIIGLLLCLLGAPWLEVRIGGRLMLLASLAAAMLACLTFIAARTLEALVLARFISGAAVATALTVGVEAVLDAGRDKGASAGSLVASGAVSLGAALGPLLAGSVAFAIPEPSAAVFLTELLLLVGGVAAFARLRHRERRGRPGPGGSALQGFSDKRVIAPGAAMFGVSLSATAFSLSLGPSVLMQFGGQPSPLLAGAMAGGLFAAATLAQLPGRRLGVPLLFAAAGALIVSSMCLLILALWAGNAGLAVASALLGGCAYGLSQLGGLSLIARNLPHERRTAATALFNIGGYVPAAAAPLCVGLAIDQLGFTRAVLVFAVLLGMAAIVTTTFAIGAAKRLEGPSRGFTGPGRGREDASGAENSVADTACRPSDLPRRAPAPGAGSHAPRRPRSRRSPATPLQPRSHPACASSAA